MQAREWLEWRGEKATALNQQTREDAGKVWRACVDTGKDILYM